MRTPSPLPVLTTAALLLAGCGALESKYQRATLEEVVRGQVASPTNRFRIPKPTIPVARRNTGIVREGSSFVVIVGPGLESVVTTYAAPDTEYGVRLVREPHVFLVLERVWAGGKEVDLFEGVERLRFDFPDLVQGSGVGIGDFPDYASAQPLPDGGALHLTAFSATRKEIAPELRNLLDLAHRGTADARRYYLKAGDVEVLVANLDPTTRLMLDFLIHENKPFDGGVLVAQRLDARRTGGIHAAVDVRWIRLASDLYFRAPGGDTSAAPAT